MSMKNSNTWNFAKQLFRPHFARILKPFVIGIKLSTFVFHNFSVNLLFLIEFGPLLRWCVGFIDENPVIVLIAFENIEFAVFLEKWLNFETNSL